MSISSAGAAHDWKDEGDEKGKVKRKEYYELCDGVEHQRPGGTMIVED